MEGELWPHVTGIEKVRWEWEQIEDVGGEAERQGGE